WGFSRKSWEEELDLSPNARRILRKMLQLDAPYDHVDELIDDVDQLLAEPIRNQAGAL
ncbi:serine/threonine protein kinase, partial [Geobacillus stearothermophilus]|nr:serine/threonine protein kinase [Geobacillus stearothermophilus]